MAWAPARLLTHEMLPGQADFCDLIIWRPDGFYDYTGIETEILVLKIENPDSTQPSDSMPKYSIAP